MHVAYFNLHHGLIKFSKLTFEGVERNLRPWNFTIGKEVGASRHQGCSHQDSAGMQCTINANIAIIFSSVKDITFRESDDLDYILMTKMEYIGLWVFRSH